MNGNTIALLLLYMLPIALGFVIFYHIIKAAVRNGIREARQDIAPGAPRVPEPSAQSGLQRCPQCGYTHFASDPACPKCRHLYS